MPPRLHRSHRGSALLIAAIFAGILSLTVAGILGYMSNEMLLNHQAHQWNQALHLAEAGIEVGFAELNYQYYQGGSGFQSTRGWSSTGSSGSFTRTIPAFTNAAGEIVGRLDITVSGVGTFFPVITAVGTVTNRMYRAPTVSRAVRTTLSASSRFPVALMSRTRLDMNGNNIYVDSYDSTDPTKSTGGVYDSSKRQPGGNVASNGTFTNTVNLGNADIYGRAYTGVGGSVSLGPNGSIGPTFVSADRASTVSQGLSLGYIQNDFNVDVPQVVLPSGATSWSAAPSAMTTGSGVGSITKSGTLTTGSYRANGFSLSSTEQVIINGDVKLYINGNVSLSGSSRIQINPGASLTVYVSGNVSLSGNGVVNSADLPIKNQWYGLPTSTSWSYTGNANWTGTIYAPNASLAFKGGGTSGDASGSVVANIITLAGQVQFHYDESLRASDTGAGYQMMSWLELRNVGGAWVP